MVLSVLLCLTFAGAPGIENLEKAVEKVNPKVITWRRHFHQYPELSNREKKTAQKIAEHLRTLGLEVQTGIAHTGVVGILRGGKPGAVVGLRADMDALPVTERGELPFKSEVVTEYNGQKVGVMHACGHDTHMAILMGVAEVLAGMKEQIPGTVKFIFQPAEEGPPKGEEGGASMMVEQGVLKNPDVDAIFGLHISSLMDVGYVGFNDSALLASSDDFRILIKGRQAHGSTPWMSADPITTGAQIVSALQTIVSRELDISKRPAVVSVGSFRGGVRSNIIPEEVEIIGTIRSLDMDMRKQIHEALRRKATLIAKSMNTEAIVEVPYSNAYPVTVNNKELVKEMLPSIVAALGMGAKQRIIEMKPLLGAEDFSCYALEVPGFFFFLGGKPLKQLVDKTPSHHTPDFFIDEGSLVLGVRTLSRLALDFLVNREK